MKLKLLSDRWIRTYYTELLYRGLRRIGIQAYRKFSFPDRLVFDGKMANEIIAEFISIGQPALIGRFGGCETMAAVEEIGITKGYLRHFSKGTLKGITKNAGVFPCDEQIIRKFAKVQINAGKQVDILGMWHSSMQDYLINETCPGSVNLTKLRCLEPYFYKNPWTAALKGKKVLVVHPFKKSIEMQYKKREVLFDNKDILPDFELRVVQAVQTIAYENDTRFADWFEALDYLYNEAMKEEFDVAIIGCGAYGLALAAKLKEAGKIAIHLGGVTQLLFGIKGRRWDDDKFVSKLYNEHWVRPMEEETPVNAQYVEGACYW